MAKKKSAQPESTAPASPASAPARRRSASRSVPRSTQAADRTRPDATDQPIDTAADRIPIADVAARTPSYDEIAEAAYHRYLRRGGTDGQDFEDWVEAEQELRRRS